MNRRGFLGGVLSAGLASTVFPGAAARAQAGEVRIGMSAAFRGAAAGLGSELGAVERGRIANLVVTDGDILGAKTTIKFVFVEGRRLVLP